MLGVPNRRRIVGKAVQVPINNNDDNTDYLEKLKDVDNNVRQRIDREFGQLRIITIAVMAVVAVVVIGRWLFGS